MNKEQMKVLVLTQPATAIAKNLHVNVGWRPKLAWVLNYKAAGTMAIAVDGLEASATEGGITFGVNAALAEVGSDGIYFEDYGITLKADAGLIRADAANIVVILFRNLADIGDIALALNPQVKPFGSGKQYNQTSSSLSNVGVTTS